MFNSPTCHICFKKLEDYSDKCSCGFQNKKNFNENELLFDTYKFTKHIFDGAIPWENARYKSAIDSDTNTRLITDILDCMQAVVKLEGDENLETEVEDGILALNKRVVSLILNVDVIGRELLDESLVKILFIGERLQKIKRGFISQCTPLRFIEVSKNNLFFSAENNVLFDKEKKSLITYARLKPEQEYFVPKSVKKIENRAFYFCTDLKTIHLSKNCELAPQAIVPTNSISIVREDD